MMNLVYTCRDLSSQTFISPHLLLLFSLLWHGCSPQYMNLKKSLLQLDLPKTLKVELHDPHHVLTLGTQQLQLNFNTPEWQQLLNTTHPLLKAVGKPTTILDACAGLGKDGFILANAGFDITSTEENLYCIIYTKLLTILR